MQTDNEISRWEEAIISLPDEQFFNTMRLYLGEIKTPYNKQRLTQKLASFIYNEKNSNSIITLLDSFDVKILTAISIIPVATQEILTDFFSGSFRFSEIYAEIANLTERLIIYKIKNKIDGREVLKINPLLEEKIKPYLNIKSIFPDYTVSSFSNEDAFSLSPNLLSAFISYIEVHGIAYKSNGEIKKNEIAKLEDIFPVRAKFVKFLMNAFINLSFVTETEKSFKINKTRISSFAKLPENQQYALLCAASVSRFSREGLKKEAQLLLDCVTSIPESGYTRESILKLAFIAGTFTEDGSAIAKKSRFSMILESAHSTSRWTDDPMQNANLLDRMIESAAVFGILQEIGKTSDGKILYRSNFKPQNEIATDSMARTAQFPRVLNIDSTFTVTIMPGLPLSELIPLTSFMVIKKFGVVTEFEITRQSVSAGFDIGWLPQSIFEKIESFSAYEVPKSIKTNITEWYSAYSSAMLFHGFILKVTDKNITFTENNPNLKKYIKEKLAEGIYLLNIPFDSSIDEFIKKSGFDFLGSVKSSVTESEFVTFPLLRAGKKLSIFETTSDEETLQTSIAAAEKLLKSLKENLECTDMDSNKKKSLSQRISNRLILSNEQLSNTAVRTEILEAGGMDFAGKVHLLEATVKDDDIVEITMPDPNSNSFITLIGRCLEVSKQEGEAVARFEIEPEKEIKTSLVSRITNLRRLKY